MTTFVTTIIYQYKDTEYVATVFIELSPLYGDLYRVGMPDTKATLNFRRQDNDVFAPVNSDDFPLVAAVGEALEFYFNKKQKRER